MRYGAGMLGWNRTNAGTKKENTKCDERTRPIVDGTETSYSKKLLSDRRSWLFLVKVKADTHISI